MTEVADKLPLGEIDSLTGSLAQRVYQTLREAILQLDCPPGTVLRKSQICEQLGVSRSPVAEAVARLSAEGLVDVIPQSATRVSRFSMADIREAMFMRGALELAAIERVASQITDEQLALLARNVRLQQFLVEDGDFDGFYRADEDFHALILGFTGFPGVAPVVSGVALQLTRARRLSLPQAGQALESFKEHEAVLNALRARDPKAARDAMQRHLDRLIIRIEPLETKHAAFFAGT